jgi:hypothetical protein
MATHGHPANHHDSHRQPVGLEESLVCQAVGLDATK